MPTTPKGLNVKSHWCNLGNVLNPPNPEGVECEKPLVKPGERLKQTRATLVECEEPLVKHGAIFGHLTRRQKCQKKKTIHIQEKKKSMP